MASTNNVQQFALLSRILHWLMAAMLLAMLFIGVSMVASLGDYHRLVAIHRPLGIMILILVVARVINRLFTTLPPFPPTMSPQERFIATASERLFYFLMFALPLVGWGMLSAGHYPIVMFGSFHLPPILPSIPALYAVLRKTHTILAYLLFATFLAHLSAVLFHTLIIRDRLLSRMAVWPIQSHKPKSQQKEASPMNANTVKHRVWMITGTSQGFGQELVRAALQRGDSVVATSRDPQKVTAAFKDASDRLLAIAMDLRDPANIATAVQAGLARFGRIDVLVNNAGHGLLGALEESTDVEILSLYETNVFGLLRVTKAVLPHFRERRSGHIVNLSSIGGLIGIAGYSIYNSTKFAVEGLSEALAKEVAPLGIRVTIVEPGPFRTSFLGGSLAMTDKPLSDYDQTSGRTRAAAMERNGNQPGDPVRAAEAIIKAITSENPPLRLLLGKFAYEQATARLDKLRTEFETWREVTLSSDFPTTGENAGKSTLVV
jgi:NAD(P)-dependent dehydrogenase (short-subunit alcohol dehydrogenase family)/cytochrome b561